MGRPNDRLILCMDLETTGLDRQRHQIVEIAAKIDDLESPVEELPSFHCYVVYDEYMGDPYALALNAVALKRIADRDKPIEEQDGVFNFYLPDEVVYPYFYDFIFQNGFREGDRITIAGKNFGSFDQPFCKRLPNWNEMIPQRNRFIDPGMMWWRPEEDGTELPCLALCKERAGITGEVQHTAIPDMDDTLLCVRAALEQQRKWQHGMARLEELEFRMAGLEK